MPNVTRSSSFSKTSKIKSKLSLLCDVCAENAEVSKPHSTEATSGEFKEACTALDDQAWALQTETKITSAKTTVVSWDKATLVQWRFDSSHMSGLYSLMSTRPE